MVATGACLCIEKFKIQPPSSHGHDVKLLLPRKLRPGELMARICMVVDDPAKALPIATAAHPRWTSKYKFDE